MLVAPLDISYFVLAYVALMIVPGFSLATVALPTATLVERLAFAVPSAFGLVSLSGVVCELLHQHFDINTYAVVAVLVTLLSLYVHKRRWKREKRDVRSFERWELVPVGVGAVYLIVLLAANIHEVVPTGWDTPQHVAWINRVVQARVFPLRLLASVIDSPNGAFYPPAFHVVSALIHELVPVPTYRVAFYSVVSVIVLMPFALYSYVKLLTSSARLGALASISSLAFIGLSISALPGGLYTLITALLIAPMLAIALYRAVIQGERGAVGLSIILGIALFYTHPTEFLTTALLDLALVFSVAPRRFPSWRGLAHIGPIAVAWGLAVWPAAAGVTRTITVGAHSEIRVRGLYTAPVDTDIAAIALGYARRTLIENFSYLLFVAVVAGVVRCLVKRQWLGLVVVQAIILFVFVDSNTYNVFGRFYTIAFPWALWYRLVDTSYWTLLPLAAVGVEGLIIPLIALYRSRWRPYAALVVFAGVFCGLGIPLYVSTAVLSYSNLRTRVVALADLGSIAWLAQHAMTGVVVNDENDENNVNKDNPPVDAGLWMRNLGGPQPTFGHNNSGPGAVADRIYVARTIALNPLPRRTLAYIQRYHVRYVFYGAAERADAPSRHLNLKQLLRDPLLQVAYVDVPTCRLQAKWNTTKCTTASYVFRLSPESA